MEQLPFKITGVIRHHEMLQGLSELLVIALDVEFPVGQKNEKANDIDHFLRYDRLGSVLTDQEGRFELQFDWADFRVTDDEPRPDIMLVVMAPEVAQERPWTANFTNQLSIDPNNVLHVSPPFRLKAGRIESYSIRIPDAILDGFGLSPNSLNKSISPDSLESRLEQERLRYQSVNQVLQNNAGLMADVQSNLHAISDPIFTDFSLSSLTSAQKSQPTYKLPDDDLNSLETTLADRGVVRLNQGGSGRLNLRIGDLAEGLTGALDILTPDRLGLRDRIPADELWRWWARRPTVLERQRRWIESCRRTFTEDDLLPPSDVSPPDSDDIEAAPTRDMELSESVTNMVLKQIDCATCPEEPLRYSKIIDAEYKEQEINQTIDGLELRGGPTDVTSYHDFHSIQIAFESVWSEIFDDDLESIGRDIYLELSTMDMSRYAGMFAGLFGRQVNKVDDLTQLLNEYKRATGSNAEARLNPRAARVIVRGRDGERTERRRATVAVQGEDRGVVRLSTEEDTRFQRLHNLFVQLEQRLSEPYKFDVFAADSCNFGVIFTYRQTWEPGPYQVGRLVNTVALAPKEERKYTTKTTMKKARSVREIEEREFKGSNESETTSRAESEIINRATNKTSFSTQVSGQLNFQLGSMQYGMNTGMNSEKFSSDTKKNFRESVLKAAQEYRKQTKVEVKVGSEEMFESTQSGILLNPNDEITVTYLFYELQRQYHISEQLHRVTPTVLVAFDVPKPHEIDNDWLMTHGWIIRRVLLDDSYHVALDYVTESSVGSEIKLDELRRAMEKQQEMVDHLNNELAQKNKYVTHLVDQLKDLMIGEGVIENIEKVGDKIHRAINPIAGLGGLFGGGDSGPDLDKFKEVVEMQLERSEKQMARLEGNFRQAQSDLQSVTEKYGEVAKQHFDKQVAVMQLRIHVKNNILHYMQAIWDYEISDQRFFRLYDKDITWYEPPSGVDISTSELVPRFNPDTGEVEFVDGSVVLPLGAIRRTTRKLVDVADLDNLLGFKGNYAIFPAKEPNYIHLYMMRDYIDTATDGLVDPDEFAEVSTQELIDYLRCLREKDQSTYERERERVIELINERQASPRREKELVVVPTDSLYMEALPGKHPVLEDFKLVHRAIDVKKVQAEVRQMELENARYADRIREGLLQDPDIDKQVVITENVDRDIDLDV